MNDNLNDNFPSLVLPDTALSVGGLTTYIQDLLEQDNQLHHVWVTGEVSSTNHYQSGLFFTLQDPEAKATISCVVWKSQMGKLATLPVQGEQLILLGGISVYPQRGSYQLVVWQVLPGGEGLRALRYRQLRKRLELEGLFDDDRKQPLPPYPQAIAVVTSPQAAAWGDIKRTLKRRHPGMQVLFSPALVQGDLAPAAIVHAIQRVEQDGRAEVLILSRGGGAVEDMACFNDERVVRAIADCPIPIVSGIGHQRDESLADLAADVCAHTPTAAAEQAVPNLREVYADHRDRITLLHQSIQQVTEQSDDQLHRLKGKIRRLHLDRQIRQQGQAIAWMRQRLTQSTLQPLQEASQRCELLRQKLKTLDPAAVLRRGYALVRQTDGTVARSTAELMPGQELSVQLAHGQMRVTVQEITVQEIITPNQQP